MAIVPNPANQYVGVQLNSTDEQEVDIQIFDSRGTLVMSQQTILFDDLNRIEINISYLAARMQWINIPQAKRNQSIKKLIKIKDKKISIAI